VGAACAVTYLLDTNVVSYFLQASREKELSNAAKVMPLSIVGEVRDELGADAKRGGPAFTKWLAASSISVRELFVGAPSANALGQLTGGAATAKNLGERASVALSLVEPGFTFVTHDKNGAWLALREIWAPGERLLGVAPFLRRLFEAKAFTDASVLDDLIRYADPRPSWWGAWRGSL
jgi:hypothetical protein